MRIIKRVIYLGLGLVWVLVGGCSTSTPQSDANVASSVPATPSVIVQGVTEGKEILQTIDLDNCNGKSDAVRSEELTMSVDVTVSAEIAASAGVSAEVVSTEVQAAVSAALSQGSSKSMSIQLTAPPGSHMNFQIAWVGNEQVGVVQNVAGLEIPIAFRSFVPHDVRIKSQFDVGCPNAQSFQEVVPQPTISTATIAPTLASQSTGVCQESGGALGHPFPPSPEAPVGGCVLIVEWWVPPDGNNCGILVTTGTAEGLPDGAIGVWWYVYPSRPPSHIQEFSTKNPQCKVEDLR